ncbi:MAG: hypothetical protein IGR76_13135 [Synechococcales cyanobacterium T60_A2020_003]|nr:hypothetical protein [Synechococcales cyanobacterium T60_A2020_003]
MIRQWLHKTFGKTRWLSMLFVVILGVGLVGCSDRANFPSRSSSRLDAPSRPVRIKEVAPPPLVRDLRVDLESYRPQVQILSPRPDEVLQTQTATVRLAVQDLPLFKDEALALGPHLHVFVDDQPYQAVYDLATPLVLDNLTPGTHTVRAFAARPWYESFKNEGAFAETTFHVFTKTEEKAPKPEAPLLTYSRPQGRYGAEPIMLDFYLTQVPLHAIAQADDEDDVLDWTIRCTINGESFEIDEWRPLYLTGFKPGQNWVQLELLDENGEAIANVFNNTVRLIDYTPNGKDALSQIVRNELSIDEARRIVIEGYEPPAPEPAVMEPAVEDVEEKSVTEESEDVTAEERTLEPALTEDEFPETQEPRIEQGEIAPIEPVPPVEIKPDQDLAPEDMPVEIVVPEVQNASESTIERQSDETPQQVEARQQPNEIETVDEGDASPTTDRSELDALTPEGISSVAMESTSSAALEPENEVIAPPDAADDTPLSQTNQNQESAELSSPGLSRPASKIVEAEPKPSPAINSYEAKAILEELEDLETKVEDLKGSVASAADEPPSDDSRSQIESLRSQLEQLKTKFGDTWERLSDFMQMKLQH